ncbi:hypothetical protein [Sulfuricurvum sp.]|uniref:hypothetical protein n=1 Tax=Sulfuricurvum sp. TaxID=2025608 RepID=UPI003BB80673
MTQLEGLMWTLIIELPIAITLLRSQPILKLLFVATSASLMTHPIAWYLSVLLSPQEYRVGFYAIETAVIVTEALWYQGWFQLEWRYSVMVSLIANTVSMILGGILF